MRLVVIALLVAGSTAFAQRPNPTGFGSVLYPGTGGPPPPQTPNGGFGSVLYPGTGGPPGHGVVPRNLIAPPRIAHPSHNAAVIVPVPVYYGGYYTDPSQYGQQPAPYEDQNSYAAPSQAPVVILNQNFRSPGPPPLPRDYDGALPEQAIARPDMPATIYLIALTDHSILPTIAYWVEGDTLIYITTEGDQNRISLALVDRDFSKKLNDDRHVEFKLPK